MKKINIVSQLTFLFFTILLFASCAFTIITISCVTVFAEREVYSRLFTYTNLIESNEYIDGENLYNEMNLGILVKKDDNIYKSHLNDFISEEKINSIVNNLINKNTKTSAKHHGKIGRLYYVITTDDGFDNYLFIITNDYLVNEMIRSVSLEINLVFFLIILISIVLIYLWSSNYIRRIRKIQTHVINLPKNKYEEEYVDEALDEIGELSKSIEEMREAMKLNEKTKQEMLQNLSHDFKTPIAVIKSYAEAQIDGMVDEESSKIILNQAEILKKKVNKLLQYNSLEYLTKDKEFESIKMSEIIDEVVQNYKYQTNIEFVLDLDEKAEFLGYRENWYTIIDNIVDNAKRFAKTTIKIVLRSNRIRIYNDGEHIDEKFIKNSFKPYEKGSQGEFGLGMSIVKKTIDFFGLNLKVINEDVGVSFIISK